MKHIALALTLFVALIAGAVAQVIPPGTNPVPSGAAYNATPPTCVDGQACWLQVDTNGNLKTVSSGSPAAPAGASNLATAQVSVTTASTAVAASRTGRKFITITAITGTQPIYCTSGTATTANGQFIPAAVGASLTLAFTGAVNCIASTSAQTVSVAETY